MLGIAANYPGDKNIGSDPDVILADNFEPYTSTQQLTSKWSEAKGQLRIATEAGHFFSGSKALEMVVPGNLTGDHGCSVQKFFSPGLPVVYSRAYFKYSLDWEHFGSNHNGHGFSGNYFPTTAGTKPNPDGTDFFLLVLDSNITGKTPLPMEQQPGFSHIYAYWPFQRTNFGDHWYPTGMVTPPGANGTKGDWLAYPSKYPDFRVMPNLLPPLGQWFCSELMVKLNTIGKNDGEVIIWFNGNLAAHFTNLFIRGRESLLIDRNVFGNQANGTTKMLKKWMDNAVIARKYIGPMVKL